jgi:hypothetical protein
VLAGGGNIQVVHILFRGHSAGDAIAGACQRVEQILPGGAGPGLRKQAAEFGGGQVTA